MNNFAPQFITSFDGSTVEIYKYYDWDEIILTNECDGVQTCVAMSAKQLYWILREYFKDE